ncbi:MAG: sugar phosphate isomerase/epimerase [Candidatus Hydrogenedentes bacterium]|nr:sugar phosphate isomerase/epimerase [Candidatus Hydrogenedentota bacterium]
MKTGMNLLLWTGAADKTHIPLIEKIASWGFDGVEFPMFAPDKSPWADLAFVLDGYALGRTAVTVLPEGTNLIGDDASERKAAVDFLKTCIDACSELGAESLGGPLYSPVGRLVGRGPVEEEVKRCVEGLRLVGEHASEAGIMIAIEPLNRFETYFLNTQSDTARVVDQVGLPSVQQMYDTFHANIEEKGLGKAIRDAGKRICHVHISANDRATPGEDHINYHETFAALKAIGYDRWLTIEAFGSWLPDIAGATCIWRKMAPSEEHLAKNGLAMIKELWGKA